MDATNTTTTVTAMTNDEKRALIKQFWRMTPVQLRQRFWRQTGYGTREPSAELVAAFVAAATTNTVEACAAGLGAHLLAPHGVMVRSQGGGYRIRSVAS